MAPLPPRVWRAFVSAVPDVADSSKVGSAKWNADLNIFLGTVAESMKNLDIAADRLAYFTGPSAAALTVLSPFGRSVIGSADAATVRSLLSTINRAGDAMTGILDMSGNKITNLGAPSASGDAATKGYIDGLLTGAALFQDGWDASVGTFPSTSAKKGYFWIVTTAGTVGGVAFSVGDSIYARVNNPSGSVYAANWQKLEGALTLAEIQTAIGFTFGTLAQASSITASLISDASANGRSFITAANYAAMKTLLAIAQSDVSGLTAALTAKADLASPALTGNPTAPTQTAGNNSTRLATTAYVDGAVASLSGLPAGVPFFFAGSSPPTGAIKANGAAVSRTTYATLFAAIGTTHGVGDGSTTFNVPDLRGEFIRGLDDSRGVDSGRTLGSAQGHALQNHRHTVAYTASLVGGGPSYQVYEGDAQSQFESGAVRTTGTTPATVASETRPRNVALLGCIKY